MADTDDEQTVALEPDQREQGEDDSAEAASERRGAGKWVRNADRPAAVLTAEEQAAILEEEEEQLRQDELELAAREERELEELRHRRDVIAAAETNEAIRLAEIAESARDHHRRLAGAERLQAHSDWAHGNHLLDEAAARPDEPGADATAAAGRRYQRAATREDGKAEYDDRVADRYDAEARARRSEARQSELPPAAEAVRNPPTEAPQARKFVRRKRVKQRDSDPKALREFGLGD